MLSNAVNAQRWWLGFRLPDPTWLNMRANKIKSGITLHSGKLSENYRGQNKVKLKYRGQDKVKSNSAIRTHSLIIRVKRFKTLSRQRRCFCLLVYPRMYVRRLFLIFSRAITGRKLSRRVLGAHYDDLLNIKNNWMKNIIWRAASFWLLYS